MKLADAIRVETTAPAKAAPAYSPLPPPLPKPKPKRLAGHARRGRVVAGKIAIEVFPDRGRPLLVAIARDRP